MTGEERLRANYEDIVVKAEDVNAGRHCISSLSSNLERNYIQSSAQINL